MQLLLPHNRQLVAGCTGGSRVMVTWLASCAPLLFFCSPCWRFISMLDGRQRLQVVASLMSLQLELLQVCSSTNLAWCAVGFFECNLARRVCCTGFVCCVLIPEHG